MGRWSRLWNKLLYCIADSLLFWCYYSLWWLSVWFFFCVSFVILKSSRWGRESSLLNFIWFFAMVLLLLFCVSSLLCHGLLCGTWLWHFLVILTCFRLKKCFSELYLSTQSVCLSGTLPLRLCLLLEPRLWWGTRLSASSHQSGMWWPICIFECTNVLRPEFVRKEQGIFCLRQLSAPK